LATEAHFSIESQSKTRTDRKWTQAEVRSELEHILGSHYFVKSRRLSSFLRTTVEYFLAGRGDNLKEYIIGTEVYGRQSSFDPSMDSIVRTEARRLRSKLNEYYTNTRRISSVKISLVAGSYVPEIQMAPQYKGAASGMATCESPLSMGGNLSIAVFPFRAPSADSRLQDLACDVTEDIVHHLSQWTCLKIFRPHSLSCFSRPCSPEGLSDFRGRCGIQVVLNGSLRRCADGLLTHLQLSTLDGMVLWSRGICLHSAPGNASWNFDELIQTTLNALIAPAAIGRTSNFYREPCEDFPTPQPALVVASTARRA
jgi:TolB-like protein